MRQFPVADIWGVGGATAYKLNGPGIRTAAALRADEAGTRGRDRRA